MGQKQQRGGSKVSNRQNHYSILELE